MNCSSAFECLEKPHGIMCVCPKGTHSVNNTCLGNEYICLNLNVHH